MQIIKQWIINNQIKTNEIIMKAKMMHEIYKIIIIYIQT